MFNKQKFKPGYQNKPDAMRDSAEKLAKSCHAYAAGGVAKIRHGQSTADGEPITTKKKLNTTIYY